MEYRRIDVADMDELWMLQKAYKTEIGEDAPDEDARERLQSAMADGRISFFGAWDGEKLSGCCSVTKGFSTFNYARSGVLEDFYICPEYRHQGIARQLVRFAYDKSGVKSLTVGCADCDLPMYSAIGFTIPLGNLLAFE